MKTVKMRVSMAGPNESWRRGCKRDVDDAVAAAWVAAGIAEYVVDSPLQAVESAPAPAIEKPRRGRKAK